MEGNEFDGTKWVHLEALGCKVLFAVQRVFKVIYLWVPQPPLKEKALGAVVGVGNAGRMRC